MSQAKRAGGSLDSSQKRSRNDTASKCAEVLTAIQSAESLPESLRDMLAAGAATALSCFKGERHEYQSAVVSWVEDALSTVQASLERRATEAAAMVTAQDTQTKLQGAMMDAQIRASDLDVAVDAAATAVEDAKAAVESLPEEMAAAGTKKAELEALLAPDAQLAQWQTVAAEQKEANAYVRSLLSKGKFEQTLLHVLASTLMVEPAARTDFDKLVLQHLQQAVSKNVAAQQAVLDAAEPSKAERATAVTDAQAVLESAKAAAQAASAAAVEAETASKQAEAELQDAQDGQAVVDAVTERQTAETLLEVFRNGPLAAFHKLRDLAPAAAEAEALDGAAGARVVGQVPAGSKNSLRIRRKGRSPCHGAPGRCKAGKLTRPGMHGHDECCLHGLPR